MPSGIETAFVIVSWAYLAKLGVWLAARLLLGDRPHPLFFINSIAHLFVLPVPTVPLLALAAGNAALTIAGVLATLAWFDLWLLPVVRSLTRRPPASPGPTLRVATFNLLWVNADTDAIIASIRALDADVIALQEVTPERAIALQAALSAEYPHRLLYPRPQANGTGLLSRLPLTASSDTIPDPDWIGDPAIASLSFDGRDVTVVSLHAAPVRTPASARDRQARALVAYALKLNHPCILMGDFNTTPFNEAYGILIHDLRDAWRAAGRGLGHTFPGPAWSHAFGDGLPRPLRRFVPHWLIRIDYVFVTPHWRPLDARTSPQHGSSDHRPVIADLTLRD